MSLIIKYYQVNLLIEKQYEYINSIENRINSIIGEEIITREGKDYVLNYPIVKDIIHSIYTIVFPIIILSYSVFRIIRQIIYIQSKCSFSGIIDITISVMICILTVIFLAKRYL